MNKFWEYLEKSVLVQAAVTLILVGGYMYLIVTERAVPEGLGLTMGTVLGFWFGTKAQQIAHKKTGR